jgi:hypothetical protein
MTATRRVLLAAALGALAWSASPLRSQPIAPTFSAPTECQLETNGIAVADVNGDGIPDLVGYLRTITATVNVCLGNGDGTFRPGPKSDAPQGGGGGIAIGDFNGDGILDVLVFAVFTVDSTRSLSVMLGNGDGTFSIVPTSSAVPAGLLGQAAAGDFNNDGKLDAVLNGDGFLVFFPGNGDGTFGDPVTTSTFPSFGGSNIVTADFNGDGNLDVATLIEGTRYVGVFLGDGAGGFTLNSTPLLNCRGCTLQITAADLTGDGKIGLVGEYVNPSFTEIALGNGDGTFQKATAVELKGDGVAVADVNGDGIPDLISDAIGIALGTGGGSFAKPVYYPTGTDFPPVMASLRNNGILDIVVDSAGAGLVLLGEGDAKYAAYDVLPLAASVGGPIVTADFNGDGKPDIAVVESTPNVTVMLGTGNPKKPFSTGPSTALPEAGYIAVGDFNHDGKADLAYSSGGPTSGTLQIYLGQGNGTFTAQTPVTAEYSSYFCLGDFNGDGKLDVANGYGVVA